MDCDCVAVEPDQRVRAIELLSTVKSVWQELRRQVHHQFEWLEVVKAVVMSVMLLNDRKCDRQIPGGIPEPIGMVGSHSLKLFQAIQDRDEAAVLKIARSLDPQELDSLVSRRYLPSKSTLASLISMQRFEIVKVLLEYSTKVTRGRLLNELSQLSISLTQDEIVSLFPYIETQYIINPIDRRSSNSNSAAARKSFIFYIDDGREGAESEAQTIMSAFEKVGFTVDVVKNWDRDELLSMLKYSLDKMKQRTSCIIVCIIGHGRAGCVHDKSGQRLEVDEVLEVMRIVRHPIPKVLIVQACQLNDDEPFPGSISGLKSGMLDSGSPKLSRFNQQNQDIHITDIDICVLMAANFGETATRGRFIPAFAEALLRGSLHHEDISKIFRQVSFDMIGSGHISQEGSLIQTPVMMSTFRRKLVFQLLHQPSDTEEKPVEATSGRSWTNLLPLCFVKASEIKHRLLRKIRTMSLFPFNTSYKPGVMRNFYSSPMSFPFEKPRHTSSLLAHVMKAPALEISSLEDEGCPSVSFLEDESCLSLSAPAED